MSVYFHLDRERLSSAGRPLHHNGILFFTKQQTIFRCVKQSESVLIAPKIQIYLGILALPPNLARIRAGLKM